MGQEKNNKIVILFLLVFIFTISLFQSVLTDIQEPWTDAEINLLKLNWLGNLPAPPSDASNIYANNLEAAKFGHYLFFDKRLSKNGKVSCATCHIPDKAFTDGLSKAKAIGVTSRSTPSLIGIAYSPWFFWDGRSDSLWSQALSPLESVIEHGGNRTQYARLIFSDPNYRQRYESIFGKLPNLDDLNRFPDHASPASNDILLSNWESMNLEDQSTVTRIFVNIAKAIAAYQRLLVPSDSRYDKYVTGIINSSPNNYLSNDEISGLKLFIGKAMCITCHQGPLFTNHGFHNVGAPDSASNVIFSFIMKIFNKEITFDVGRYNGVKKVKASEFNCIGSFSDAKKEDCSELIYMNTRYSSTLGAFKVPTLRNIAKTAPYFQHGQFATLSEVLNHYNNAPDAPVGHSELTSLGLTSQEMVQIEAFLVSLSSPPAVEAAWLMDPH